MTIAAIIGLDQPPTTHHGLLAWVTDVAALTEPDAVVWCDGSDAERERLTHKLIEAGTFIPLEMGPRTFRCAMDPEDVAEVGRHTYVCAREESTVDPGVNWMEPVDMKIILTEEYRGCMRGRTMYVVPFLHLGTDDGHPMPGVQITDSEYVVVSMHLDVRCRHHGLCHLRCGRRIPAMCAFSRGAAPPRAARRAVAVRPHQIRRPIPRNTHHLELRVRLRQQRPAGQGFRPLRCTTGPTRRGRRR